MDGYEVRGVLPVDSLPRGTRLLGLSPPMLGGRALSYRFLAQGLDAGEAAIVVTTDKEAGFVADAVASHAEREGATRALGVVDATGQTPTGEEPAAVVRRVGSPSDLTGIGMAFSDLVSELRTGDLDRFRVAIDSLSSLVVYSEFERVYRFVHVFVNRLEALGAASLVFMQADAASEQINAVEGLFDGVLEIREGEDGPEHRLRGLGGSVGEWRPLESPGIVGAEPAPGDAAATPPDRIAGPLQEFESLRDLIERVEASGYTLTLCNHTGPDSVVSDLESYFGRLNTTVRTASLSTESPRDVAVLHRGDDALAMSQVQSLHDAVSVESLDDDGPNSEEPDEPDEPGKPRESLQSDVLEEVHRREYTVENGGKLEMVRISRLVETRALETGGGTLHAGFQRVSRLDDELDTRRMYERLAAAGVDVHLYGEPGPVPAPENYTLHTGDADELREAWFVVFDGAGDPGRTGSLVCEETAPSRYSGFWTYAPGVAHAVDDYLRETYPPDEATP